MSVSGYSILLKELSSLDVHDITKSLPKAQFHVPPAPPDTHGELVTLLVLALTPVVLTATSLWLLKIRKSEVIELKVSIRTPEGVEKETTLRITRDSSTPPDSQIIEQIASALRLPKEAIMQAASGT